MKRKVILYLLPLFILLAAGAVVAGMYIRNTTTDLGRLVKLHQIGALRQDLVISIQAVQSDLYTVNTSLGNKLEEIIDNVSRLEKNAANCTSCHHEPAITANLEKIQSLIGDYQNALSYYITASANTDRIDSLKIGAAKIGNNLLVITEHMSQEAAVKLSATTNSVMVKINKARNVLMFTFILSCVLGIFIAVRLTMAITRPINDLAMAAGAISRGEVGHTISYNDSTEIGELASSFNAMSLALEKGYEQLHKEIIERKQTEEALRTSEERYALSALGANDGLWDWDLKTNEIYLSTRWKSMLGYDDGAIGSSPEEWFALIHPDDLKQLEARISAHIEDHSSHLECEYRIMNNEKKYRWVLNRGLAVRDREGKAYRMAGSQTDITERKIAEEQLIHDAFHDALTGLPNRALFMDRLQHRIQQISRGGLRQKNYMFAVLFLDLDRFKVINDSLGHMVGDQLLIAVGERLLKSVRPEDTVARLGGDEFAVILEDVLGRDHAEQITTRLQKELMVPMSIQGQEVFTAASVGIALSSTEYERPEDMVRDADIAMYQAKAKGKTHCEVFDAGMYKSTVARLHLETDLRRAVEHNEFLLHYQPIIELKSDRVLGFEALIRWNHPKRGLIYPKEFIPLAEETGMIIPLGEWILNECCRQLHKWQRENPLNQILKMSVNISGKQFLQPDLSEMIEKILLRHCIDACSLTLEITESMIMEDVETAITMITNLRNMGIHIHIDDFGTGYSSLSYIHRFPVNALKIDRSFVEKMMSSDENLEIVKTIVSLANNLKLDIIAEGLEMTDQLTQIRDLKCLYGQGFLISRPMDAVKAEHWMTNKMAFSDPKNIS